jgi:hypothetical protein
LNTLAEIVFLKHIWIFLHSLHIVSFLSCLLFSR